MAATTLLDLDTSGSRIVSQACAAVSSTPDKSGRLRRSTQHLLEVYSQASQNLRSFSGVDSSAAQLGRAALENSQTGQRLEAIDETGFALPKVGHEFKGHHTSWGNRQLEMARQDGVENFALCHHLPNWLLNQDSAEDLFCSLLRLIARGRRN
jgi:hypothetical protein